MIPVVGLYQNDFVVFSIKDGAALCDRCDPSWRSNAKTEDEDGSAEPHVSSCHLIRTSFIASLVDSHSEQKLIFLSAGFLRCLKNMVAIKLVN